jgi:hypothetical protein
VNQKNAEDNLEKSIKRRVAGTIANREMFI